MLHWIDTYMCRFFLTNPNIWTLLIAWVGIKQSNLWLHNYSEDCAFPHIFKLYGKIYLNFTDRYKSSQWYYVYKLLHYQSIYSQFGNRITCIIHVIVNGIWGKHSNQHEVILLQCFDFNIVHWYFLTVLGIFIVI